MVPAVGKAPAMGEDAPRYIEMSPELLVLQPSRRERGKGWGFGDTWSCPIPLLHPAPTPVARTARMARMGLLGQRLVVKDRVRKARDGSTAVLFFFIFYGL